MKDLNLIIWITQLGMSVVVPLVGFIILGAWLHTGCGWGVWSVWVGIFLGVHSAVGGIRDFIKTVKRMSKDAHGDTPPPVCFNDHD